MTHVPTVGFAILLVSFVEAAPTERADVLQTSSSDQSVALAPRARRALDRRCSQQESRWCPYWQALGFCSHSYVHWMHQNCGRTCGVVDCNPAAACVPTHTAELIAIVSPAADRFGECEDKMVVVVKGVVAVDDVTTRVNDISLNINQTIATVNKVLHTIESPLGKKSPLKTSLLLGKIPIYGPVAKTTWKFVLRLSKLMAKITKIVAKITAKVHQVTNKLRKVFVKAGKTTGAVAKFLRVTDTMLVEAKKCMEAGVGCNVFETVAEQLQALIPAIETLGAAGQSCSTALEPVMAVARLIQLVAGELNTAIAPVKRIFDEVKKIARDVDALVGKIGVEVAKWGSCLTDIPIVGQVGQLMSCPASEFTGLSQFAFDAIEVEIQNALSNLLKKPVQDFVKLVIPDGIDFEVPDTSKLLEIRVPPELLGCRPVQLARDAYQSTVADLQAKYLPELPLRVSTEAIEAEVLAEVDAVFAPVALRQYESACEQAWEGVTSIDLNNYETDCPLWEIFQPVDQAKTLNEWYGRGLDGAKKLQTIAKRISQNVDATRTIVADAAPVLERPELFTAKYQYAIDTNAIEDDDEDIKCMVLRESGKGKGCGPPQVNGLPSGYDECQCANVNEIRYSFETAFLQVMTDIHQYQGICAWLTEGGQSYLGGETFGNPLFDELGPGVVKLFNGGRDPAREAQFRNYHATFEGLCTEEKYIARDGPLPIERMPELSDFMGRIALRYHESAGFTTTWSEIQPGWKSLFDAHISSAKTRGAPASDPNYFIRGGSSLLAGKNYDHFARDVHFELKCRRAANGMPCQWKADDTTAPTCECLVLRKGSAAPVVTAWSDYRHPNQYAIDRLTRPAAHFQRYRTLEADKQQAVRELGLTSIWDDLIGAESLSPMVVEQPGYRHVGGAGWCTDVAGAEGTARKFAIYQTLEQATSACDADQACVAVAFRSDGQSSALYTSTGCTADCSNTAWLKDQSLIVGSSAVSPYTCHVKNVAQEAARKRSYFRGKVCIPGSEQACRDAAAAAGVTYAQAPAWPIWLAPPGCFKLWNTIWYRDTGTDNERVASPAQFGAVHFAQTRPVGHDCTGPERSYEHIAQPWLEIREQEWSALSHTVKRNLEILGWTPLMWDGEKKELQINSRGHLQEEAEHLCKPAHETVDEYLLGLEMRPSEVFVCGPPDLGYAACRCDAAPATEYTLPDTYAILANDPINSRRKCRLLRKNLVQLGNPLYDPSRFEPGQTAGCGVFEEGYDDCDCTHVE